MGPWCRRPVSGRSQSDAGVVDGARSVPVDPAVVAAIPRDKPWLRAELEREPDGWLLSHDAGSSPLRAKSLGEAVTARPPPGHQMPPPTFSGAHTGTTRSSWLQGRREHYSEAWWSHRRGDAPGLFPRGRILVD